MSPTIVKIFVAGVWTSGNAIVTINATSYTQAFSSSQDDSLTLLAAQIATDINVSTAVYDSIASVITITSSVGSLLIVWRDLSGVVGTMTFGIYYNTVDISYLFGNLSFAGGYVSSGDRAFNGAFLVVPQIEFSEGSCVGSPGHTFLPSIDLHDINLTFCTSYVSNSAKIYLNTDLLTIYAWPFNVANIVKIHVAGTWISGSAVVIVNSTSYTQAFSSSQDNSLTLLAAQIATDINVSTATYDSIASIITITSKVGSLLIVTCDLSGIVGTMTLSIGTYNPGQIIAFTPPPPPTVPPSKLVVGGGWRVTRNYGSGWTDTVDTPSAQDHRKIINPNDGIEYSPDYIVVGMDAKIFRSSNHGTTWQTIVIKELVPYPDLRAAILRVVKSRLYVLWENNIGL